MTPELAVKEYIFELIDNVSYAELETVADEYDFDIDDIELAYDRALISISFEEN